MTIDSWELVSGDWEIYLPTTAPTHAKVMCTEVLLDCLEEDTMLPQSEDAIILIKLAITPKYVC